MRDMFFTMTVWGPAAGNWGMVMWWENVHCLVQDYDARNQDLTDSQQVDVSSFNDFLAEIEAAKVRGDFPPFGQ